MKRCPLRRERDVGGAAEIVAARRRLPADGDLQQLLAVRRELDHHRAGRVGRPDVALRIDPDRVRHHVQPGAPRSHDLAVAVHHDDRIGLVAALQEVDQTVAIRGDPRHHAHRPAVARRRRLDRRRRAAAAASRAVHDRAEFGRLRDRFRTLSVRILHARIQPASSASIDSHATKRHSRTSIAGAGKRPRRGSPCAGDANADTP